MYILTTKTIMRKQSLFVTLYLTAMFVLFTSIGVNAQVTIGSNNPPSQWSLLDLDASDIRRALHLPRLDNDAREALFLSDNPNQLAEGLMIFNTETRCLEFWNGTEWVSLCDGDIPRCRVRVPATVHPSGWLTFMCHNLGADPNMTVTEQMAYVRTSNEDHRVSGYLFQWGRGADRHQERTSGTTATLSNSNTPGHGNFITTGLSDWRSPHNDNLWGGGSDANNTNNPCPSGWRVPTEAEWQGILTTGANGNTRTFHNVSGSQGWAFTPYGMNAPTLFLPVAGFRNHANNGVLSSVGAIGYYWSSTANGGKFAHHLRLTNNSAFMDVQSKAFGFSMRCVAE